MNEPKSPHVAFDFNCTRQSAEDGPAHCVLCYGKMVRAVAKVYEFVEARR